jgi:hypothetical protein
MLRRRTATRRSSVVNVRHPKFARAAHRAVRGGLWGIVCEALECRTLLSSSFDLVGLTAMRNDPNFSFLTGQGIGIAVLDTGVFAQNPDLRNNFVGFYNAVQDPPSTPLDTNVNDAFDNQGHGTHVSGIAAASDPNIGVAYQAKLIDIRVLQDPTEIPGQADPILNGLLWVEQHHNDYNIKVINMSIGTSGININANPPSDAISQAIHTLEGMGVTVVSAVGNSYASYITPGESIPAAQSTVGVGNIWSDNGLGKYNFTAAYGEPGDPYLAIENSASADLVAATSQRSTLFNQIFAPGMAILSTWNSVTQPFNTLSGTSMASPLVAGTVALMQQAAFAFGGRYLDPQEVITLLHTSADHIVDSNVTTNGRIATGTTGPILDLPETGLTFDRLNVDRAIQQVKQTVQQGGLSGDTNNTIGTSVNTTPLNGANSVTVTGNIGKDGTKLIGFTDVDVYKINVLTPGTLTITSSSGPPGTIQFDMGMRLFNSAGTVVLASAGGNGVPYPTLLSPPDAPLPAGTYYLGVAESINDAYNIINGSGAHSGGSQGDYQINITVQTPDPGGVYPAATPFGLNAPSTLTPPLVGPAIPYTLLSGTVGQQTAPDGSTITFADGDVHFYSVVAPDSGKIAVQATGSGVPLVDVFDVNGNRIGSDITPFTVSVTAGQTYYIGVTTEANSGFDPNNPFTRATGSTASLMSYDLYVGFTNGDANGTLVTATPETLGTPVNGTIGSDPTGTFLGANGGNKDVDFYAFTAASAGIFKVTVAGNSGFTPRLSLWNSSSGFDNVQRLADASPTDLTLYEQVTAGQQVLLAVTGQGNQNFNGISMGSGSGGTTGSYVVNTSLQPLTTLSSLSDNSINSATPTPIQLGQTISGNIGIDGSLVIGPKDVDMYVFVAPDSRQYTFQTITDIEGSADTVMRIFDNLGNQVAINDNASSTTTASSITLSMLAGQTYYIGINGAGSNPLSYNPLTGAGASVGSTGPYNLQVTDTGVFQRTVTFEPGKKLTITDASGHKVTLSLNGPGTGQLVFNSTGGNDNIAQLILTGTDGTSSLTVNGNTPIGKITVTNSLGNFNATQVNLTGDMSVGGGLGKLTLASASNGTISIGSGGTLVAKFGTLTDESLSSSELIKSLTANQWATTLAARSTLSAPSIQSLNVKGDFNEDVGVSTLGKFKVGSLTASAIRAASTIDTVTAGNAGNSLIFAGLDSSLTAMPSVSSDFTNTAGLINNVDIHGTFSNTQIAAWHVKKANLRSIQTSNGGTPFGIAGNKVDSVSATANGKSQKSKNLFSPLAAVSLGGDALIRLIG